MKQITIQVPNTMLEAVLAFCRASGIRKVAVLDDDEREDAAMLHFMEEADRTDVVPFNKVLDKLREKAKSQ